MIKGKKITSSKRRSCETEDGDERSAYPANLISSSSSFSSLSISPIAFSDCLEKGY